MVVETASVTTISLPSISPLSYPGSVDVTTAGGPGWELRYPTPTAGGKSGTALVVPSTASRNTWVGALCEGVELLESRPSHHPKRELLHRARPTRFPATTPNASRPPARDPPVSQPPPRMPIRPPERDPPAHQPPPQTRVAHQSATHRFTSHHPQRDSPARPRPTGFPAASQNAGRPQNATDQIPSHQPKRDSPTRSNQPDSNSHAHVRPPGENDGPDPQPPSKREVPTTTRPSRPPRSSR
ncbi:hypothetical protein FB390_0255 [Nocardia bhagyanarayanae]|uniref:Uncharacterized protein n=1 Tax=Nocardia bhagyanarayanae TaxID=1215925 RepID=A0A543F4D4_9NOCA|nr:hypothetical protein FB390_0255 [Nocardia bhagyanarayanae]